jgi:hypothetical protein
VSAWPYNKIFESDVHQAGHACSHFTGQADGSAIGKSIWARFWQRNARDFVVVAVAVLLWSGSSRSGFGMLARTAVAAADNISCPSKQEY